VSQRRSGRQRRARHATGERRLEGFERVEAFEVAEVRIRTALLFEPGSEVAGPAAAERQHRSLRALRVVDGPQLHQQPGRHRAGHDALALRKPEDMAQVHQRPGQRPLAAARLLADRHFVVAVDVTAHVCLEDLADADHAELMQFCRAQRADAGGADDAHAPGHDRQDLLVPRRRRLVVHPIKDQYGVVVGDRRIEEISVAHRWQRADRWRAEQRFTAPESRPDVYVDH
jgi:hypothetical protein